MSRRILSLRALALALVGALLPLAPVTALAQEAPAAAGSTAGANPGLASPAPATTTNSPASPTVAPPSRAGATKPSGNMDDSSMEGMDHGSMEGMDHGSMKGMGHGSRQSLDHGSMHGGSPPPDGRSPDYSDGIAYGPIHGMGMAMEGNARYGMLLVDQLEAFHGRDGNGQQWDIEGWYGNDYDKLWLRTEGERRSGRLEDASGEVLWSHAVAAFWNTQLGLRTDAGEGPDRSWAAFGLQGLAPYWFELEATGYVGPAGRTAARFRAEYELMFTQRLVLQPELEANVYGKADPARGLGRGLTDMSLGLRLRYEFHRQFAPYVGVVWTRRFGGTADLARQRGQDRLDRQWVAGVRIWF
ncbi:copper resistance protein B [Frateuria sp. GZRe12]|uniref:copper resistance protein B n=1 Tax=Frateuria sp. GZRe12 TaxID=3351533 RepID=UPI003EDCA4A3